MNALRCPQCEAPHAAGAPSCDQCGFPLPKRKASSRDHEREASVPQTDGVLPQPVTGSERKLSPPPAPKVEQQSKPSQAVEPNPTPKVPLPDNTWQAPQPRTLLRDFDTPRFEKEIDLIPEPSEPEPRQVLPVIPIPERGPAPVSPPIADTSKRRWKLVVVEGFSVEKEYLIFKDTMILGRRDADQGFSPDIDLEDQDDGFISRKHAVLRLKDQGLVIEDLGGENGTTVNGRAIEAHALVALEEGNVLRLGRVGLLVVQCPLRDQDGHR